MLLSWVCSGKPSGRLYCRTSGRPSAGTSQYDSSRPGLAILKQTRMPWVLCECGFITNPENAAMMKDHPGRIAEAIAEGVKDYLNQ